jgi:hypothetical protein
MEYEESVELVTEAVEIASSEGSSHVAWHRGVDFTSLVLALLAATATLLAGITAREILLERTEEVIDVSRFEGDRGSIEVLEAKHELLIAIRAEPPEHEVARIAAHRDEARELDGATEVAEAAVVSASSEHLRFAIAATVIAVAIAITGLSVMMARRWVWLAGSLVGAAGTVILITAFIEFAA